jgi:hypothetical protein
MPYKNYPQSLSDIPEATAQESYILADYAEMLCVADQDEKYDADALRSRIQNAMLDEESFSDDPDSDGDLAESSGHPVPVELSQTRQSNIRDRAQRAFGCIEHRADALKNLYPFQYGQRHISLNPSLDNMQKLYLQLLYSSNLAYVSDFQHQLTNDFEKISLAAMKCMLPQWAEAHIFGKGSHQGQRYVGNTYSKMKKLAEDTRTQLRVREDEYSSRSTGDDGLDIVAWLPLPDALPIIPVYFAQCSCHHSNWIAKQSSAGDGRWRSKLSSNVPFQAFSFSPTCFRNGYSWARESEISTILIDRVRLLRLLEKEPKLLPTLEASCIADELRGEKMRF